MIELIFITGVVFLILSFGLVGLVFFAFHVYMKIKERLIRGY